MDQTLELLKKRHSVRSYSSEIIPEEMIKFLRSELTFINTHESGLNFQLFLGDKAPFKGFTRSYGMFRNVRNYMAAIIDPSFEYSLERAGYFAQQFVMECTHKGLGTCFVGGTFSRDYIPTNIEIYEKIPFVVTFGYAEESKSTILGKFTSRMAHRNKKSPRLFYDGDDSEYNKAITLFNWLPLALEAISYAPSAVNRQPVRLKMIERNGNNVIIAYTVLKEPVPVDLGIAKFNVASIIPGYWEWGEKGAFTVE